MMFKPPDNDDPRDDDEVMAEADDRRKHPPCLECGATSLADADEKCRCGGDKDHCHGCELWPVG